MEILKKHNNGVNDGYLLCGHELDLDVDSLSGHQNPCGGHDLKVTRLGFIFIFLFSS